jgi:hypothetical protein
MSLEVDDEVKVTSEVAPFFGKQGLVEEIDGGYRVLPLIGVRFPGRVHLYWYTELELGPVGVESPTAEIPAVAV